MTEDGVEIASLTHGPAPEPGVVKSPPSGSVLHPTFAEHPGDPRSFAEAVGAIMTAATLCGVPCRIEGRLVFGPEGSESVIDREGAIS